MSISQDIAPHLPYLRRFARALTGSQHSGDAYAVATLETIIADPSAFRTDVDARVALYGVFLKVWGSVAVNGKADAVILPIAERGARRSIEAITPRPRVAFLLTMVEGFTTDQAAAALDAVPADVTALVDAAATEISQQIATDVLIIEDEPIIALDLQALAEGLGHTVTEVARTRDEALAAVARRRPGLVLADIQLADGSSGLDAVNDILGSFDVPVIFITAYPERLLTGERPEPAFLITKPFRVETVKAVISQALFFDRRSHNAGGTAAAM